MYNTCTETSVCKSPPNTASADTSSQAVASSDGGPTGPEMTTPPSLLTDDPSSLVTAATIASQDAPDSSGESPFLADNFQ